MSGAGPLHGEQVEVTRPCCASRRLLEDIVAQLEHRDVRFRASALRASIAMFDRSINSPTIEHRVAQSSEHPCCAPASRCSVSHGEPRLEAFRCSLDAAHSNLEHRDARICVLTTVHGEPIDRVKTASSFNPICSTAA